MRWRYVTIATGYIYNSTLNQYIQLNGYRVYVEPIFKIFSQINHFCITLEWMLRKDPLNSSSPKFSGYSEMYGSAEISWC